MPFPRREVQETVDRYHELRRRIDAGLEDDAFWGARYAVVSDPEGNGVGIMSPVDPARRSEPPAPG